MMVVVAKKITRFTGVSGGLLAVLVSLAAIVVRSSVVTWLHSLLAVSDPEAGRTADVIIVLGYALFKSGEPTEPLKGRVAAAVLAFQEGLAGHVILSGAHPGEGLRGVSEANAMYRYAATLMGQEPNPERWLREEASTSTRENAIFSLKMARDRGWTSVLLVTSPFHQRRSLWTFQRAARDLGLHPAPRVSVAKAPFVGHEGYGNSAINIMVDLWDWLREVSALVYYKLRKFI